MPVRNKGGGFVNKIREAENKRKLWLDSVKSKVSSRDFELLERASAVLTDNLIEGTDESWGELCGILPSPREYKGIWNWDTAFHALGLSYFDTELAFEQFGIFFSCQLPDGMFPDVIYQSGERKDTYSKPPVFPWAFVEVYKRSPNKEKLKFAYEKYKLNEQFWRTQRYDEKYRLFHYDAKKDDDYITHVKWESGMDNSPRWDDKNSEWLAADLNGFMVMFYNALEFMATELEKIDEAEKWHKKSAELKEKINAVLWNDEAGIYIDVDRTNGEFSDVITSASFVPMFAGCTSEKQVEKIAVCAADRNKFYPAMPTVAYDSPKYSSSDYWRGPVWLNYLYFAVNGLKKYGYDYTAREIRETVLDFAFNEKRDIFEYYDSKSGEGLGAIHFGWSAVFIIELIIDKLTEENL